MRKIAVVTGTRAEYGLMYWIMRGIQDDPELELQLIVTGMHLSSDYGRTVESIEADGFPIADKVEMLLSSDSETAVSTSMGLAMIGFAKSYERLKPDILMVVGDRFETFSAVAAAIPFRIPIAHIHGGESTEGSIDESFRHAITKMSHIHFPATQKYAERIIQMGENPNLVFCYGAPGIDSIFKMDLLAKDKLIESLGVPCNKDLGIVTYHPATVERSSLGHEMSEIFDAILRFYNIFWIFTFPNADTGSSEIFRKITYFEATNPDRCKVFISLGQLRYLSLLKHARVMVGNSSSGLIEAPSFRLPVVNIGDRQKGRIRASNVIDVAECSKGRIHDAIEKALSTKFYDSIKDIKNPYGDGTASEKILQILKRITFTEEILKKHFCERP